MYAVEAGRKIWNSACGIDTAKGVGITTTIKSTSSPDDGVMQSKRLTSGRGKASRPNESERVLKDDSSEEFLPVQRPVAEWGSKGDYRGLDHPRNEV